MYSRNVHILVDFLTVYLNHKSSHQIQHYFANQVLNLGTNAPNIYSKYQLTISTFAFHDSLQQISNKQCSTAQQTNPKKCRNYWKIFVHILSKIRILTIQHQNIFVFARNWEKSRNWLQWFRDFQTCKEITWYVTLIKTNKLVGLLCRLIFQLFAFKTMKSCFSHHFKVNIAETCELDNKCLTCHFYNLALNFNYSFLWGFPWTFSFKFPAFRGLLTFFYEFFEF